MRNFGCVVVIMMMSWVRADIDNTVCKIPTSTHKPPNKPVLPDEFETHVVLNILSRNCTTELHQFYSFQEDHSVIEQRQSGTRYYAYADYKTDEFLGIFPDNGTCIVTSLSSNENRFLFGYKKSHDKVHTASPDNVLHFFERDMDSVERYVGKATVRGIPCTVWYSCTFWENMQSTMNIYWYFSDPDQWSPSATNVSIPVRAWVQGRRFDTPGLSHDFEHKYEFMHWKTKITKPYYWQTPRAVSCPGRVNSKPLPAIPQQFSFTLEQVDKDLGFVTFVKEWYDKDNKLFRYDYRPGGTKADTFGTTVLSEVHDFNTGIAYVMDSVRGNCSIMPIEKSGLDELSSGSKTVTLKSAVEFFFLDGVNPSYEGVKQIRGVDADTWVATRQGPTVGSKLVWEYAFLSDQWSSEQQDESTEGGGMPVQLTQTEDFTTTTYFNVYNFKKKQPDHKTFDITPCYYNRNRRVFQFTVSTEYKSMIIENLDSFTKGVVKSVVLATGLSPLRIGKVQVNFESAVSVKFEILDIAPIAGDVKLARKQIDLKKAGDLIISAIRTNSFTISLVNSGGSVGTKTISPQFASVTEQKYDRTFSDDGFSTGTAAGVAVAMAFVGMAIGGGVAFGVNKRFMIPT